VTRHRSILPLLRGGGEWQESLTPDAHLIEGTRFVAEAMQRWPDKIRAAEKRADWIPDGWRRDPREHLARGQIYVTCEGEDTTLAASASQVGEDCIMYATDFPHWDSAFPEATGPMRQRTDISESLRAKVLAGNARRFFAGVKLARHPQPPPTDGRGQRTGNARALAKPCTKR